MKRWICPRCKKETQGFGATSRRDNSTQICSDCGTAEALFDWKVHVAQSKGNPLPEEEILEERKWLKEVDADDR